ncbi:hypothetical protein O6H91_Y162600 [Diphasiastrum complanatum]|nr:hypothetical protein O6H91_Y162600 [Diphasiastrum complanatum]
MGDELTITGHNVNGDHRVCVNPDLVRDDSVTCTLAVCGPVPSLHLWRSWNSPVPSLHLWRSWNSSLEAAFVRYLAFVRCSYSPRCVTSACSSSLRHLLRFALLALQTVCCTPMCARWRDFWQTTAAPRCPINCSLPLAVRYLIAAVCPPAIYLLFLPVHCLSVNIIPSGHSLHYGEPSYAKRCESKSILSLTERA